MDQILADAELAQQSCEVVCRGHYMAARRCMFWNRTIGILATLLTGLVGISIFSTLERQPSTGWKIAAGILSLFAGVLSSIQTSLKLDERAENHRTAGARYRVLMREFVLLRRKIGAGLMSESLQEYAALNDRRAQLAQETPTLPDRVWAAADREVKRDDWPLRQLLRQRVSDSLRWAIDRAGWLIAVAAVVIVLVLLWQRADLASVRRTLASIDQPDGTSSEVVQRDVASVQYRSAASAAPDASIGRVSDIEHKFAQVRHRPPLLRAFLQRMPKGGDLHTHLSGAIYAESFIAWAAEDGLCIDLGSYTFVKPECTAAAPPAKTALTDRDLYARIIDAMSLRNFVPGARSGHDQFFDAFDKFGLVTSSRVGDMLAELASRAAAQHVTYAEIMQTLQGAGVRAVVANLPPESVPASLRDVESGAVPTSDELARLRGALLELGLGRLVELARHDLDAAEETRNRRLGCDAAARNPACQVTQRYLQQTNRNADPVSAFAQLVFAVELAGVEPRVVGLNMVGPEDYRVARRDYARHMAMLDFLWHTAPRTNITLHAGELTLGLVPPTDLRSHIRQAIEVGHARRLGHAVSLGYEDDAFGLLRELARRQIDVEINLSSNDQILGVSGQAHPFLDYRRAGVPVTLSTDDDGLSRSDMTNEYQRALEAYDLQYAELKAIVRNSLAFSFLPGATLWQSTRSFRPVEDCAADEAGSQSPSDACARFLGSSERAREQWRVERALLDFERLN